VSGPRVTRAPWELEDGRIIELIRPEELSILAPGTKLYSIFGNEVTVGVDYIDGDTRGGMIAYGLLREDQSNRDLGAY